MAHPDPPSASALPVTQWSLVSSAAGAAGRDQQDSLSRLLQRYYAPMRAHLMHRFGADGPQADDWVQGFIADRVLERHLLAQADRSRGRFRSFLLTALDNYVLNHLEASRARKRSPGGAVSAVPLHEVGVSEGPAAATSSDVFDLAWARHVLDTAIATMRQECCATGKEAHLQVFEARVLSPALGVSPPEPFESLVSRLSLRDRDQASNLLTTAKLCFRRILRQIISEYAAGPDAVEDEIRDLMRVLSRDA